MPLTAAASALRAVARHILLVVVAAASVVGLGASGLALLWLLVDPGGRLPDAPYAWVGLLAVGGAFALPVGAAFAVTAAPLARLVHRRSPPLGVLVAVLGGAVLAAVMTVPVMAVPGAVGGAVYATLAARRPARI